MPSNAPTILNRICLGTAQFGLDYGVANSSGRILPTEVAKILEYASACGIQRLDTAAAYGSSESVIGRTTETSALNFQIYSKLTASPQDNSDIRSWTINEVHRSLERLNIEKMEGLLVHSPDSLTPAMLSALDELRNGQIVSRVGISVYHPRQYERVRDSFHFDLVQIPINLFDQRFLRGGQIQRWKADGVEIHARSAFLQGALLNPLNALPSYFVGWKDYWSKMDSFRKAESLEPIAACLYPLLSLSELDCIIIGVDGENHLRSIIETLQRFRPVTLPESLQCDDEDLILPYRWKLDG